MSWLGNLFSGGNESQPKDDRGLPSEVETSEASTSSLDIDHLNGVLANWKRRDDLGEGVSFEELQYYNKDFSEAIRQGYHSEMDTNENLYLRKRKQ